MAEPRSASGATPEQTIDEVIRDLVSTYPGTIQRVDKAENMAMLRLNRRGSTWAVCIARAEDPDA